MLADVLAIIRPRGVVILDRSIDEQAVCVDRFDSGFEFFLIERAHTSEVQMPQIHPGKLRGLIQRWWIQRVPDVAYQQVLRF
jgi:hypothetical protein